MKKQFWRLFLLLFLMTTLFAVVSMSVSAEESAIGQEKILTPGDVNSDGVADIADIVAVINVASGTALDPAEYLENVDITGDGVTDIADIVAVINIASGNTYTITFDTDGGSMISPIVQSANAPVTEPDIPEKDGYTFGGWYTDKACTQAYTFTTMPSENLMLYAKWIETYTIAFLNHEGVATVVRIIEKGSGLSLGEIDVPDRMYHRFIGWYDESGNRRETLTDITADLTLTARYTRQYTVRFVNYAGITVSEQRVDLNGNAELPPDDHEALKRDGYTFVGWNGSYTNVTEDVTVVATYAINEYTVRFLMPNGELIDTQEVKHGFYAVAPSSVKEFVVDQKTVYRFTGWNEAFDLITADTDITAEYALPIEDPVLYMETVKVSSGIGEVSVTLKLLNCASFDGVSIDLAYEYPLKLSQDGVITYDGQENFQFANASTTAELGEFSFAATTLKTSAENGIGVLNLTFRLGTVLEPISVGEYEITILEGSYFFDEDLVKITPIYISGAVIVE